MAMTLNAQAATPGAPPRTGIKKGPAKVRISALLAGVRFSLRREFKVCCTSGLVSFVTFGDSRTNERSMNNRVDEFHKAAANKFLRVLESGNTEFEVLRRGLAEIDEDLVPAVAGVVLQKLSNVEVAQMFFDWCTSQQGFRHTTFTINCLLGVYLRRNRPQEAYKLFREQLCRLSSPNNVTYGTLISGFCKAGDLEQATVLVKEMESRGLTPHDVVFNVFIKSYFEQNRPDDALSHYRQMQSKCGASYITYKIIVGGLLQSGRTNELTSIIEEMVANGCPPKTDIVHFAISGLCNARKVGEAMEVYNKIMLQHKFVSPSRATYNYLLRGYCKAGKPEEGVKLLLENGYVPSFMEYEAIIDCLIDLERYQDALDMAQRILVEKKDAPSDVLKMLIECFSRAGQVEFAYDFFQQMVDAGCIPDVNVYNTLLAGACVANKIDDGLQLLERMVQAGCPPNTCTYNTIICGLCKAEKFDHALELYETSRSDGHWLDTNTCGMVLEGLRKTGRLDDAQRLLKEIESNGCPPSTGFANYAGDTGERVLS